MDIYKIYKYVVLLSPRLEVFFRKLYWKNISKISKIMSKQNTNQHNLDSIDFAKIIDYLGNRGINKGGILIVHSSDNILKRTGESPKIIINKLLDLIGPEGTLAMPVFRKFKGEHTPKDDFSKSLIDKEFIYNLHRTPIWTGLLPRELMVFKNVKISRFPINPLASVGKLSGPMMENNLKGDVLLPHGINSSWKFCVDNDANIIGLGIDLVHSLTIVHTIEDCQYPNWPINNWYNNKIFNIVDLNFEKRLEVFERKAIWGMYYDAELNLRKDLIRNNILFTKLIEEVPIEIVNAKSLYTFLQVMNKKNPGYPYYVPKKFLRS